MNSQYITTFDEYELKELIRSTIQEVVSAFHLGTIAPKEEPYEREFVNLNEAVKITGMSRHTLYEKTSRKEVPHYKRGKRLYFKKSELIEWIASGKVTTQEEQWAEADAILERIRQKDKAKGRQLW